MYWHFFDCVVNQRIKREGNKLCSAYCPLHVIKNIIVRMVIDKQIWIHIIKK